jgi:error-prone DNA polymerase
VPLFQEQLMQMAIDVAGFTGAESDQLRQAMGSKRSGERMERLRARLYGGMAERGITGDVADAIYEKLAAFANFGFPESHSVSFAYLVYASAWIKHHFPAAFCAALLNAQPMGFWSPKTLVADARRHGVEVRRADVNASAAQATLEPAREAGPGGRPEDRAGLGPELPSCESPGASAGPAVRLGLEYVRTIGLEMAERIAAGRPYADMEDLVRRTGVSRAQLEALATAGALAGSGARRAALWAAGAVSQATPDRLDGMVVGARAPTLPDMTTAEEMAADLWATGMSPTGDPIELVRDQLDAWGATTAAGLAHAEPDSRVLVGGIVTHRQRPATAQGTTFLNLEDETGLINVICSKGAWSRYRQAARSAPALLVRGRLERVEGVVNVVADRISPLSLTVGSSTPSRDFR